MPQGGGEGKRPFCDDCVGAQVKAQTRAIAPPAPAKRPLWLLLATGSMVGFTLEIDRCHPCA